MNHYKWLEKNLNDFWLKVFDKNLPQTNCAGIIGAHGDKAYQYRDEWEEAGIHFYHGVAIYLLTYTKELGDTPKHESCQWVIDNYEKYSQFLNPVNYFSLIRYFTPEQRANLPLFMVEACWDEFKFSEYDREHKAYVEQKIEEGWKLIKFSSDDPFFKLEKKHV